MRRYLASLGLASHRRLIVTAAWVVVATAGIGCAEQHPTAPYLAAGAEVKAWSTWVLPASSSVRPPHPYVRSLSEQAEHDEIVQLQRRRTRATDSLIAYWDGDPTSHWTRIAVDRLDFYWPLLPDVRIASPVRAGRIMALLHVALHDVMIAVWDAKYTYHRRPPAQADERIATLVRADGLPSYPSEHAAAAAAAMTVLSALFMREDSILFARLARDAAESRIVAGAAHRSDVEAGWTLGVAVARSVLDWAARDGASDPWTGTVPTGPAMWRPTPPRRVAVPFDANAGSWKTWILPAGNALRLPSPPALGSETFMRDLAEVRRLADGERTVQQADIARYWATDAPSTRWELFLDAELAARRWSIPHAARARAYLSVAMHDAFIACWDSKFTYWLARPVTVDPQIRTVFSTPPFPSYPSGHSTISTAASVVMSELFPDRASDWHHKAEEASLSRVWGGVHYRFDVIDGDSLGARVGRAVVQRMRTVP